MGTRTMAGHVIVTGGASGIGAAVVRNLRDRGLAVSVFDLHPPDRDDVHSDLVDLRDDAAVDRAVAAAWRRGPVGGVVACHGIRGAYVPALEMDVARLREQFEVHVVGSFSVARAVVRRLDGAPGSIVLISSTTAYRGWANQVDYGTAKAAERQLMENLAVEWAPLGVRVNAIAPGHTRTPMVESLIAGGYDIGDAERRTPRGTLAAPEEIAEAVAWMLCDASHVIGQCLPVDGGWTVVGK
ncbi:SDR family oxidoreductase [Microbacterium panaciterrae]|uniref:SDR family oxidoreductase n=1 Tax=Microbacterium panaciterrae TaxID=985759 RepID=A0ABP8PIH2_9MICO